MSPQENDMIAQGTTACHNDNLQCKHWCQIWLWQLLIIRVADHVLDLQIWICGLRMLCLYRECCVYIVLWVSGCWWSLWALWCQRYWLDLHICMSAGSHQGWSISVENQHDITSLVIRILQIIIWRESLYTNLYVHAVDWIDGLKQETHNSIANAVELPLSCTKIKYPHDYITVCSVMIVILHYIVNSLDLFTHVLHSCFTGTMWLPQYLSGNHEGSGSGHEGAPVLLPGFAIKW